MQKFKIKTVGTINVQIVINRLRFARYNIKDGNMACNVLCKKALRGKIDEKVKRLILL